MPIALSSADVAQLEAAFTTFLSPLDAEQFGDRRIASRQAVETLLGAENLGGLPPLTSEAPSARNADVTTARTRYRVRGSYAIRPGPSPSGADMLVFVLLERVTPEPWPDAALRTRFRLTPREMAVARLLAERRPAREIAGALGISVHTARRHTEHVYAKLGLRSRRAVAEALRAVHA